MNHSRRPGSADQQRIDDLVRRSNAGLHTAITGFVDGDHRRINEALRSASPPNPAVRRFLDELQLMRDYVGTSYRVSQISPDDLAALRRGHAHCLSDPAAQSAFVLPGNAAAWALRTAAQHLRDGAHRLFSIFDESVPQKNLSTTRCVDHVVVLPGTRLCLRALRIVADPSASGPGRPRIVAHFSLAEPCCATPGDP